MCSDHSFGLSDRLYLISLIIIFLLEVCSGGSEGVGNNGESWGILGNGDRMYLCTEFLVQTTVVVHISCNVEL